MLNNSNLINNLVSYAVMKAFLESNRTCIYIMGKRHKNEYGTTQRNHRAAEFVPRRETSYVLFITLLISNALCR